MKELLEYRNSTFDSRSPDSDGNSIFLEESFFIYVSDMLSNAGILDDAEYCPHQNASRGTRIDGYSWNALEKTICGIIIDFTNNPNELETLTNTQIEKLSKRLTRFFENAGNESFINSLDMNDHGHMAASAINQHIEEALKFRVVIFSDNVLSSRVKKVEIEDILGKGTSIEIWDLERICSLDRTGSEFEEFTVNFEELGSAIRALPANTSEHGFSTYLAVMPASLLSAIYHEHGQRLLESNVRTFLDFRAGTNRGMRKSLMTEPEHFFAYNNGLTVTATGIETRNESGILLIASLDNMQIVNGGQTTAAIYFSPLDKGGIKGADQKTYQYSDIDLGKVYVQMKLTVIDGEGDADFLKKNIAQFANTQNSIQLSDLESNHPFHLNIETRSRQQLMPAGENGLSTKWFYERTRGQYSTTLRALSTKERSRFELEYPKKQLFTKTDMAKYENTWRMNPNEVKKGAQANLKALGKKILIEFEKNEEQFGPSFYQDLVAKMILFRMVDSAVLNAEWYKEERGLKAEIVTYSIALLRHKLREQDKDIDLGSIYKKQSASPILLQVIVSLAKTVRENITDVEFTDGANNPSEFCKSDRGWKKIQFISVDLKRLGAGDILSSAQLLTIEKENKGKDTAGQAITGHDFVMSVSLEEWHALADYNSSTYPPTHKNVAIPRKCAGLHQQTQVPSDRQMELAKQIREVAIQDGFEFI